MGPVSTATILELAETANRVDELAEFVFTTSLTQVARAGIPPGIDFQVAVNVTPTELVSPRLVEIVQGALRASRLPPNQLVIELNERIVADGEASLENIDRLVALGVKLALDDFGEGRTSLAHLRGLPISQLKMDRGLVQQAAGDHSDHIILSSMISLAHDLNFEVVAEGVETSEQLRIVVESGADLLQGFGLYRPMEIGTLRDLLRELSLTSGVEAAPVVPPRQPPRQQAPKAAR
jgi:EAL domain-containing protein (putative c-di-GMP-specific phosphodiesterase class I)